MTQKETSHFSQTSFLCSLLSDSEVKPSHFFSPTQVCSHTAIGETLVPDADMDAVQRRLMFEDEYVHGKSKTSKNWPFHLLLIPFCSDFFAMM